MMTKTCLIKPSLQALEAKKPGKPTKTPKFMRMDKFMTRELCLSRGPKEQS
jgi:hypothetical protein